MFQRNAAIHRAALFFVHLRPARNLIQSALTPPAHVISQNGAAMTDTGTFGRNFMGRLK
jgi:hypothetical protein